MNQVFLATCHVGATKPKDLQAGRVIIAAYLGRDLISKDCPQFPKCGGRIEAAFGVLEDLEVWT